MTFRPPAQLIGTSDALSPRGPLRLSCRTASIAVAGAEVAAIVLGSDLGTMAYTLASQTPTDTNLAVACGLIGCLIYVSVAQAAGLYRFAVLLHPSIVLGRIMAASTFLLLSLTAVLFFLKVGSEVSRGAVLGSAVFIMILCSLTRMSAVPVLHYMLRRKVLAGEPVQLLGDEQELASLPPDYLLRHFGMSECGRALLASSHTGELLQGIAEGLRCARQARASRLVVVVGPQYLERLHNIEHALGNSPLPANLLPGQILRSVAERHGEPGSVHLTSLQRAPLSTGERARKRALDIVGALCGLVLTLPILLGAAIAVKLDSRGPIIFRQRRNGFDQQPFWIYKFRTMIVLEDGDTVVQARKNDSRVTRVGRFLRRTSIDELPQLLNVVRGEMSLVGPRPHALAHDQHFSSFIDDYYSRHHMKPGITGWAQINGLRGETRETDQIKNRIENDLWYINNWSLLLDCRILVRTVFSLLGDEAY